MEGFDFRIGRRVVCVCRLNPLEDFSSESFFRILLDPFPMVELVFKVL